MLVYSLTTFVFSVQAAPNDTMPQFQIPELQVKIPTLNLTPAKQIKCENTANNTICSIPWIGEYIAGIYRYAIGIVGILSAVVLMVGGVLWIVAGGNATMIGEAKSWITASLTGLIIALCSYLILYQVNPALTIFQPLKVALVKTAPTATSTIPTTGLLTQTQAEAYLVNFRVQVKDGVGLEGIHAEIINEMGTLAQDFNNKKGYSQELIWLTSGLEGQHAQGTYSHANGWKIDLRNTNQAVILRNLIKDGTKQGTRNNEGTTENVYKNNRGFCYAEEGDHWDVYTGPLCQAI
jgi:hypothetical protein